MSVSTARPAATVVVARDRDDRSAFDVLMLRRNDKVAFMGGAYVFPGGRVDERDAAPGEDRLPAGGPRRRFADLAAVEEWSYRTAAARELEEEAAVRIDPLDLVPLAHWVTPEVETRRYDTRFFVIRMPVGQKARHDGDETTALAWLTPRDAIRQCVQGEIMLPPPTWTTLKRMSGLTSVAALLDWAATVPIVRVQPLLFRETDRMMLTLPGDLTFPTFDGWEVPEDTRFVLQDGQWRPTPA
jgi:8-oxo-dGTP pyrophosphatase MutT (NUDIX family)